MDYKQQVESLKDAEPWTAICLTRHAIAELGGKLEDIRRNIALDFPHAWLPDPQTDNIFIVRLREAMCGDLKESQSYIAYVNAWFGGPKERKPSILDITRSFG